MFCTQLNAQNNLSGATLLCVPDMFLTCVPNVFLQLNAQNNFSGATPLHYAAQESTFGDQEGRDKSLSMLLSVFLMCS